MLKVLFSRCALQNKITAINTQEQHLLPCLCLATEAFNKKCVFSPSKLSWGHSFHWRHRFLMKKTREVFEVAGSGAGNMGRVCVRLAWKLSQNQLQGCSWARTPPSQQPCAFPLWLQSCSKSQAFIPHRREKKKIKKEGKPKVSSHPSLDQLFFFTAGNCIVSLFSCSTDRNVLSPTCG